MKNIAFIFCFILVQKYSFSQDTIFVKDGDTNYMFRFAGFLDSLPDGHYTSYHAEDKNNIHIDIFYKNGQKEGIETRYNSMFPKEKYATIQWKKGQKNGNEIHYLSKGILHNSLTYVQNDLNGRCIMNQVNGKKEADGYFLNNFRDSIWNFYEHDETNVLDTSGYWLHKQYVLKNGKEILLSAWNRNGLQTAKNGEGFIEEQNFETRTIENFSKGLKNGKTTIYKFDSILYKEQNYLNNYLVSETEYYNNHSVAYQKEYTYLTPETVDTISVASLWVDNLHYNEVVFSNQPVPNGYWVNFYQNGNTIYEGAYKNGLRVGKWKWDYANGKPRIRANYDKNEFQHFDTTGTLISSFPNEFLTKIVQSNWFLNQNISENEIILTNTPGYHNTDELQFYYTGKIEMSRMIYEHVFDLIGDKLTLGLVNPVNNHKTYYHFKIMKVDESQIVLKSINRKGRFKSK